MHQGIQFDLFRSVKVRHLCLLWQRLLPCNKKWLYYRKYGKNSLVFVYNTILIKQTLLFFFSLLFSSLLFSSLLFSSVIIFYLISPHRSQKVSFRGALLGGAMNCTSCTSGAVTCLTSVTSLTSSPPLTFGGGFVHLSVQF